MEKHVSKNYVFEVEGAQKKGVLGGFVSSLFEEGDRFGEFVRTSREGIVKLDFHNLPGCASMKIEKHPINGFTLWARDESGKEFGAVWMEGENPPYLRRLN